MTDEILEKAKDNRNKFNEYESIYDIVEEMEGNPIRIIGHTGSFTLPAQLNDAFIKMMTDYLNDEMFALNEEYKEL